MSNYLSTISPSFTQSDVPVQAAVVLGGAPSVETQTQPAVAAPRGRLAPADKEVAKPEPKPLLKFDSEEMMQNLREALDSLNEQAKKNGRGLNFSVDEKLNRHIITVRNTQSGEVVRQIPTEVAIKVAHNIEDIKGLLLDERT
jgi:flagellar protein FlaG